jgi:carbonic anhydrase/acetyltransferase-like protein (isoleucine patch superfamily)
MTAGNRRYALPFAESIEGRALVHYAAQLDRVAIVSPDDDVKIGAARLEQCVVVGPCEIEDDVVAVAAILQGHIGAGCRIGAHSDIQGHLGPDVVVGEGVLVGREAFVGEGAELGDRSIVEEHAIVHEGAVVGVDAVVRRNAIVDINAVVSPRTEVAPGGFWSTADTRQGGEHRVRFITDDDSDDNSDDNFVIDSEEEDEYERGPEFPRRDELRGGYAPLLLSDFNPGTARSWALTKLARAASTREDWRLDKETIRKQRPDLVDHPVTQEVLRRRPAPTADVLNDEAMSSLSTAHYDVFGTVRYHSGGAQMLGDKDNDVFVLGVPPRVIDSIAGTVGLTRDNMDELFLKNDSHPDVLVRWAVGWVRTLLYYPALVVIVEVQSDREWMKFKGRDGDLHSRQRLAAKMLREMYFKSFGEDAVNIIVEWAFNQRYREVFVLDRKSRAQLGGTPPKDYYDTIPKKFNNTGVKPLPRWIDLEGYSGLQGLTGRSIRPNRRS